MFRSTLCNHPGIRTTTFLGTKITGRTTPCFLHDLGEQGSPISTQMFLIEFDTARSGLILRQHRATACTELLRLGFGKYRYMFDEVLMKISCRFVIKSFTVRPKEGRGSPQHISQPMQKHKHNLPSLPKIQNMSHIQIVFYPKIRREQIQKSNIPNIPLSKL